MVDRLTATTVLQEEEIMLYDRCRDALEQALDDMRALDDQPEALCVCQATKELMQDALTATQRPADALRERRSAGAAEGE
jgi:hypothetical protein